MKPKRRILVIDDHPVMRAGYTDTFSRERDLEVCGQAGTAREAMTAIAQLKPDLVVLDLHLPDREGIELIKDIHTLDPTLPVLAVSMFEEMHYARPALRAGARGYVMKSEGPQQLVSAARLVLEGRLALSPAMTLRLLKGLMPGPAHAVPSDDRLTDREQEVLRLIGAGWSTDEIAARLGIGAKTVHVHRGHLREKLGLRTTSELLRYAIAWVAAKNSPRRDD